MGFWSFLRDMFVFDWGVGEYRKRKSINNQTRHSDYNKYSGYNGDCEFDHYPESSGQNSSYHGWDDDHYGNEDYYHDSSDSYAHDFDDFEDDF